MKKIITFQNALLFLLISMAVYRFDLYFPESNETMTVSTESDSTDPGDGFKIFCLAPGWVDGPLPASYWNITNHLDFYKELNFNASQMYVSESNYLGRFSDNILTGTQKTNATNIVTESNLLGMDSYLERVRISALCYSQRLIYEVGNGNSNQNRKINFGFAYENNMIDTTQDSGRSVLHAQVGLNSAGYLCKDIYENLQHTDLYYIWNGSTDTTKWKLKPVMRIKQSDFSDTNTTEVVAIATYNYLGKRIDSTIIEVRNFGHGSPLIYGGDYKEKYNLIPLIVSGSLSDSSGLNFGRPGKGAPIKDCKVDFKVYWFGLVDVWFDKMIVDDERADELFAGVHDIKIQDEMSTFQDNPIVFYVDELVSSQAHTTKYVRDKMRVSNQNVKMQFALSNNLNLYSHRDTSTRNKLLFDVIKPDIVCLDDHVFLCDTANLVYLPDNAEYYDDRIPQHWIKPASEYNDQLQKLAFGNKTEIETPFQGTFIYQIYNIRKDLMEYSNLTKFTVQPHLHSWTKTIDNKFRDGGFREPINEEIQAQGMIAIAHGAEGLNWNNYHSTESNNFNYTITDPDTTYTVLGLRNESIYFFTKRTENIIFQNKWEYVKAMNLKILHWKPTLDKIKWDNGYSVHYETADHNFIKDIKSLIVRPGPQTACFEDNINYDCFEEKYWEMGFFNPDFTNPAVSSNDKSKYFIMVNRRCVPDETNSGDLRQLKIKFDSTDLAGFVNWKIIELDSNNVVAVFNKNTTSYIDMGIFDPGEGKLYKLAPVMQEGGTLVANEECIGNFTCKG